MSLKIISKAVFPDWVDSLCDRYRVVAPRQKQNEYIFEAVQNSAEVCLDYTTTILPPKKVLLPQHEQLFSFKGNGNSIELAFDDQPVVLFGVHTCDMHAIALLDQVFARNYPDQHYLNRRENAILVSLECLQPCSEYAFCRDMGTLVPADNYDLHLTDLGDEYAVDISSERGAALLDESPEVRESTAVDYQQVNQIMSQKWSRFPYRLEVDLTELPSLLAVSYRGSIWEELGEKCLGCGACNLVCPTCYCFNVKDEVDFSLTSGSRYREWDSCQLDRFTVVAGGHDFRATRGDRLRHRFFRKYKYMTNAYGGVGCVGCGRCAKSCLVDISPIDVLNTMDKRRVVITARRQEVLSS
jgi:sulfhydrogenase subunit beta (sulfur reductase)